MSRCMSTSPQPSIARRSTSGVAALELAFLLPALVAIPAAAWDLGRALHHLERLHHGVRAAVRHLATGDAANPLRQDEARRLVVYGRVEGTNTPAVPGLQASMVNILEPESTPGVRAVVGGAGPVSLVTVQVQGLRYEPLLWPASWGFTFSPISLTLVYRFI